MKITFRPQTTANCFSWLHLLQAWVQSSPCRASTGAVNKAVESCSLQVSDPLGVIISCVKAFTVCETASVCLATPGVSGEEQSWGGCFYVWPEVWATPPYNRLLLLAPPPLNVKVVRLHRDMHALSSNSTSGISFHRNISFFSSYDSSESWRVISFNFHHTRFHPSAL